MSATFSLSTRPSAETGQPHPRTVKRSYIPPALSLPALKALSVADIRSRQADGEPIGRESLALSLAWARVLGDLGAASHFRELLIADSGGGLAQPLELVSAASSMLCHSESKCRYLWWALAWRMMSHPENAFREDLPPRCKRARLLGEVAEACELEAREIQAPNWPELLARTEAMARRFGGYRRPGGGPNISLPHSHRAAVYSALAITQIGARPNHLEGFWTRQAVVAHAKSQVVDLHPDWIAAEQRRAGAIVPARWLCHLLIRCETPEEAVQL